MSASEQPMPASEQPTPTQPADAYDEVPYVGRAVHGASPDAMAVAATLAGLAPAPPARCRYLELGSGAGAHLLALAFRLPEAELIGIERSASQHAEAERRRRALGLTNVRFVHADLRSLDEDLGELDYIVAHGLVSWVAPAVRRAFFDVLARRLRPQGVAFVSYNTPSGWAVRSELRRVLLAASAGATTPSARIERVRATLHRLLTATRAPETVQHAAWLDEVLLAAKRSDADLLHDLLAPEGEPIGIRALVEEAREHGLDFLAELARAHPDPSAEDAVRESLEDAGADPLEAHELSDYLFARQLRATLLARRSALAEAERPSAREALGDLRLACELLPTERRPSLDPDVEERFLDRDGVEVGVTSAPLKAALLELADRWPATVSFEPLSAAASDMLVRRRVRERPLEPSEEDELATDLLALHRMQRLELTMIERPARVPLGPCPRVSALTRLEAELDDHVSTPFHRTLRLDAPSRALVGLLDGGRTLDEARRALEDATGLPLSEERARASLAGLVRHGLVE